MESFLNIAWVLVSVLGICAGVLRYCAQPGSRTSIGRAVVALIVISVLLFPVISLTDDLNPAIFTAEALSRRSISFALLHAHAGHATFDVAWLALQLFAVLLVTMTIVSHLYIAREQLGFSLSLLGRAPPIYS